MEVTTKKAKLFVETKTLKDGGKIKVFTTTIGTKLEDGSYMNKSVEVSFAKEVLSQKAIEKLEDNFAYDFTIENGFLTTRSYTNKDGKRVVVLVIKVLKGKITGRTEINKVGTKNDSELPF